MAAPAGGGLFASLRQLLGTLLEIAHVRIALLVTELEREKLRLFDGLLYAALGLMLLALALLGSLGVLLMLFAEGHRLLALALLTFLSAAGGGALLWLARQRLQRGSPLLALSLQELQRDRDAVDLP